jgi:hypothetical protein
MKQTGIVLLALALTATGCVEMQTQTDVKQPLKESAPLVPVEAPPVRPDQVNDANARQSLDTLRDELDRAANEPTKAPGRNP